MSITQTISWTELAATHDPREGRMLRIMNEKGEIINKQLMPEITEEQMLSLYEAMVTTRLLDTKALALQRSGRMGTFAQVTGQEAHAAV